MSQPERTRALQTVRDGRARVCVATDVAARGLDLPDLGLVVHADLPQNPDLVLHRSGRTGRAGRKGTCVILVPYPARRYAERLIASAKVRAKWGPAPSAEEIRAKDHERIVGELAALEDASEEDLTVARELLTTKPAEQFVAALVRFQRGLRPAPEELTAPLIAPATAPARRHDGPKQSVWFCLNVGHRDNADPRWIVPFLCRRGHITRAEIGKIRIFDEETRFEIAESVADKFATAARRPDPQDPKIRIERSTGPERPSMPPPRHGPPRRRPPNEPPRRRAAPEAPASKPRRVMAVPKATESTRARARRPK
jgi:ATP-dependent RNA helicase DeaD